MEGKSKYKLTYLLWLVDLAVIIGSFLLGTYLRFHNFRDMGSKSQHFYVCIVFALMCTIYSFAADYNRDFIKRGILKEAYATLKYEAAVFMGTLVVIYFLKLADPFSRAVMGYMLVLLYIFTWGSHLIIKELLRTYWEKGETAVKVLVLSEKEIMMPTIRHLQHRMDMNYRLVGAVCLDEDMAGQVIRDVSIIANRDTMIETVTTMAVDEVFINTPGISQTRLNDIIGAFNDMGVTVRYCVELPNISGSTEVGTFGTYPVVSYIKGTERYRAIIIKRIIDIIGGGIGLIFTAILTPFVALAIKLDSPGPVFFSQTRIGRNGRRFSIYKFRSMYIDAEERKKELAAQNEMSGLMFKMKDDPRITKVGAFIRKTSIDELPQFLNIVKGDMSLVGTRPPTEAEFEQYNQYYRRRISMTPGLTGMWQVSGRSDIEDFDEVVKLDLQYIDNWSLGLDIKIIFKTVGVVLFGRGAS